MALDAMPKNSSDDRALELKTKYDLAPQYYEDIIWLSRISFQLTPIHHQEFLSHIIKTVSSPVILHDLVISIEQDFQPIFQSHTTKNLFKQLVNMAQQAYVSY